MCPGTGSSPGGEIVGALSGWGVGLISVKTSDVPWLKTLVPPLVRHCVGGVADTDAPPPFAPARRNAPRVLVVAPSDRDQLWLLSQLQHGFAADGFAVCSLSTSALASLTGAHRIDS